MIAILHCLSPLSDCLIVCTAQRVLIQRVKREEEFATCSSEKMCQKPFLINNKLCRILSPLFTQFY